MEALEADTGVKLRVLAQNYPQAGRPAGAAPPLLPLLLLLLLRGRLVDGSVAFLPPATACMREPLPPAVVSCISPRLGQKAAAKHCPALPCRRRPAWPSRTTG